MLKLCSLSQQLYFLNTLWAQIAQSAPRKAVDLLFTSCMYHALRLACTPGIGVNLKSCVTIRPVQKVKENIRICQFCQQKCCHFNII